MTTLPARRSTLVPLLAVAGAVVFAVATQLSAVLPVGDPLGLDEPLLDQPFVPEADDLAPCDGATCSSAFECGTNSSVTVWRSSGIWSGSADSSFLNTVSSLAWSSLISVMTPDTGKAFQLWDIRPHFTANDAAPESSPFTYPARVMSGQAPAMDVTSTWWARASLLAATRR